MGDPKIGDLAVRIGTIGHASPRWKSAKTLGEADKLNRQLSELRAQNVHKAVEDIIKKELPGLKIELPSKGVGSTERFPTASEDNAAVDRSVVVTVELTTTDPTFKLKERSPRRVYVPSKIWTLQVEKMINAAGFGYVQIFVRVSLENPYSGKKIRLSGWVLGGGAVEDPKLPFKLDKPDPSTLFKVGDKVSFSVDEAMDFDDWKRGYGSDTGTGTGRWAVRMGKLEVRFGLKTSFSYLAFSNLQTDPDMLIFSHKWLGVGKPGGDAFVTGGFLTVEGENPGDYVELASVPDIIPTQSVKHFSDGLLLSFPTGKAKLQDLTSKDRKELTDFVTNKARNIAVLSLYSNVR